MKTHVFQIQNIIIRRIYAIAHNFDDASRLLSSGFILGMGGRPEDTDFDVVRWKIRKNSPEQPLQDWADRGLRGIAWSFDDGRGWELFDPNKQS